MLYSLKCMCVYTYMLYIRLYMYVYVMNGIVESSALVNEYISKLFFSRSFLPEVWELLAS